MCVWPGAEEDDDGWVVVGTRVQGGAGDPAGAPDGDERASDGGGRRPHAPGSAEEAAAPGAAPRDNRVTSHVASAEDIRAAASAGPVDGFGYSDPALANKRGGVPEWLAANAAKLGR